MLFLGLLNLIIFLYFYLSADLKSLPLHFIHLPFTPWMHSATFYYFGISSEINWPVPEKGSNFYFSSQWKHLKLSGWLHFDFLGLNWVCRLSFESADKKLCLSWNAEFLTGFKSLTWSIEPWERYTTSLILRFCGILSFFPVCE